MSVIDDGSKFFTKGKQFGWAELAFEDAVLKMIATSANRLKDFLKPFIVANVVADQISRSHGVNLRKKWIAQLRPALQESAYHSNSSLSVSSIQKETDRPSRFQPNCQRAILGVRGNYEVRWLLKTLAVQAFL
jgi:hypothetical protein